MGSVFVTHCGLHPTEPLAHQASQQTTRAQLEIGLSISGPPSRPEDNHLEMGLAISAPPHPS
eukprot:gene11828-3856_t